MKNKNKLVLTLYITLILFVSCFSLISTGKHVLTSANITYSSHKNIVRDSNGILYISFVNDTTDDLCFMKSIDDGATWTYVHTFVGTFTNIISICIDSNNIIRQVSQDNVGPQELYLISYNPSNNSWYDSITVTTAIYSNDIDVSVDQYDNIHMAYSNDSGVFYKRYTADLSSWSSATTIRYGALSGSHPISGVNIRVYNDQIYIAWAQESTNLGIFYSKKDGSNTWTTATKIVDGTTYAQLEPVIEFDSTGKLYLVWRGMTSGSGAKYAIRYTTSDSTFTSVDYIYLTTSFSQYRPSISISSSDDIVHVMWYGQTNYTSTTMILYKNYTASSWSGLGYLTSGSHAFINPVTIYQNYPTNMKIQSDDASFIYFNDTTNKLMYDDTGGVIWYSVGGTGGLCNLNQYQSKGSNTAFSTYASGDDSMLHQLYRVPINTTITGVELTIDPFMYNTCYGCIGADNRLYYNLYINGVYIGSATEIVASGSNYIVRWCGIYVTLNNEVALFEFKQNSKYSSYDGYWNVGIGSMMVDLDQDGVIEHTESNTLGYVGNKVYNDLAYKFYYNTFTFVNTTSPYSDSVTSSKNSFETFDNVPIYYTVSSFSYPNKIELWRNGVQQFSNFPSFPYNIITGTFKEEISFTPLFAGSYKIILVRNGVTKSSFNFTVTNPSDMNFTLSVYPNPFHLNDEVRIFYRFYTSDGSDGFIGVSDFSNTIDINMFNPYWIVSSNTSGNKSFSPPNNVYVTLWKKVGTTYSLVKTKYLKMYGIYGVTINTINVQYNNIKLTDEKPSVEQKIYGTQAIKGFKTFIRVNGEFIQYVTDNMFYSVYYNVINGGVYNAQLCMETFNGTFVICQINFTASPPDAGGGLEEPQTPVDIFGEYAYVFGIGIIVMFLLLPMTVASRLGIELPMIVNIGSAGLGLAFTVLSGFLPIWVAFLTVVSIVVAGIFVMFGR